MDLREAMRSPELSLEPSPALERAVRRGAARLRWQRRLTGTALGLAALTGGGLVVPTLLADPPGQVASGPPVEDFGIREATSEVVLLDRVNGAAVVAYYEGADACVAAVRVTRPRECRGPMRPATASPFPAVFNVVSVDDRRYLAGTVSLSRPGSLLLDLERGEPLVVTAVSGRGFVLPVFYVELPPGAVPVRLRAVDLDGADVATRPLGPAGG